MEIVIWMRHESPVQGDVGREEGVGCGLGPEPHAGRGIVGREPNQECDQGHVTEDECIAPLPVRQCAQNRQETPLAGAHRVQLVSEQERETEAEQRVREPHQAASCRALKRASAKMTPTPQSSHAAAGRILAASVP